MSWATAFPSFADWIPWEEESRSATGKSIISTEASPMANGLRQIFHFHRIQFEAAILWVAVTSLKWRLNDDKGSGSTLWNPTLRNH